MKKILCHCVMLVAVMLLTAMAWGTEPANAASQVKINSQNFPDKIIRKVARSYDKNKNGYLSRKEISKIKKVDLNYADYSDEHIITNYKGLERFTNLRFFRSGERRDKKSKKEIVLDLSRNKKLETVYLGRDFNYGESNVTKLKLTNCKKLKELKILDATRLKTMDLRGCAALKIIGIWTRTHNGRLTTLDVSSCPALKQLWVFDHKKLSQVKLGTINKLEELTLDGCPALNTLDLRKQTKLKRLDVSETSIRKLDVKRQTELKGLHISKMSIRKLDIRNNVRLEYLSLRETPVKELNLKKQKKLRGIEIYKAKLKRLDLSGTKITKERCLSGVGNYYCSVHDNNVSIVLGDGEKLVSPVDSSFDWE